MFTKRDLFVLLSAFVLLFLTFSVAGISYVVDPPIDYGNNPYVGGPM